MYRNGEEYNAIAKLVGDVYIDYNITTFPIDVEYVCKIMGINLIPYTDCPTDVKRSLFILSSDSLYFEQVPNNGPTIYYNDVKRTKCEIKRNILHEIKHYICNDKEYNPEDDDLADYFGKYFLAPISYIIVKDINNIEEIISTFEIDESMAKNIISNLNNRKNKYGNKIFEYEKPLLKHLLKYY